MKRTPILWLGGGGLFLALCFLISLIPTYGNQGPTFAIATHVPFGWWYFLKRNLPEMTLNWITVSSGIVFSALFLIIANWLSGTVFSQIQRSMKPDESLRRWRWRWTVCMYAGLWLLFAIAVGSAGLFQQTTWLARYRQPWYEEQPGKSFEFALAIHAVDEVVGEKDRDPAAVQKSLLSETNFEMARLTLPIENYDVIFYKNGSNQIAAFLIIPRRLPPGSEARFYVGYGGYQGSVKPLSELQKTTAELNATYLGGH